MFLAEIMNNVWTSRRRLVARGHVSNPRLNIASKISYEKYISKAMLRSAIISSTLTADFVIVNYCFVFLFDGCL